MSKGKYYNSIDELPVLNWNKCIEDDSLEYLIISGKPSDEELQKAWANIESEIIEIRLQDPKFITVLKEKKALALRMIKAIERNDAALKHKIKIEQENIKQKQQEQRAYDMYDVLDYLSRTRGVELDETKVSVRKYLTYLKNAQNGR